MNCNIFFILNSFMMLIDLDLLENYFKIIDYIKNNRFCNSIDEELIKRLSIFLFFKLRL